MSHFTEIFKARSYIIGCFAVKKMVLKLSGVQMFSKYRVSLSKWGSIDHFTSKFLRLLSLNIS